MEYSAHLTPSVLTRTSLRLRAVLGRTVLVLGALAAWEVFARLHWVDPLFVSRPSAIPAAMLDLVRGSETRSILGETTLLLGLAFSIGTGAGVVAGILLGTVRAIRDAYLGPLVFIMSTPKTVFLPIFLVLVGAGSSLSVAFGAFSAFFYVAVNVVGGVDLVEERHRRVARAFGAHAWHRLSEVILPAALPGLFAALWHGVKHAFVGVLIAQLFASQGGIGQLVKEYTNNFDSAHLMAVVLAVSVVSIIAGSLWNRLEAKAVRWRADENVAASGAG